MQQSDTPRTDAEPPVYDGFPSTVSRDFARTLEREVEELKSYIKLPNEVPESYDSLFKERDQLRQQLEDMRKAFEVSSTDDSLLNEVRSALEIADGSEITRDHVKQFGIDFSKHECGCEVCAKSIRLCPATQSSLAQEIIKHALQLLGGKEKA